MEFLAQHWHQAVGDVGVTLEEVNSQRKYTPSGFTTAFLFTQSIGSSIMTDSWTGFLGLKIEASIIALIYVIGFLNCELRLIDDS